MPEIPFQAIELRTLVDIWLIACSNGSKKGKKYYSQKWVFQKKAMQPKKEKKNSGTAV